MKEVEFNSHMGYVAGRTDADLLIHEKDEEEAGKEKIHVLQVSAMLFNQPLRIWDTSSVLYKIFPLNAKGLQMLNVTCTKTICNQLLISSQMNAIDEITSEITSELTRLCCIRG